jgi:hypothetical protein
MRYDLKILIENYTTTIIGWSTFDIRLPQRRNHPTEILEIFFYFFFLKIIKSDAIEKLDLS